MELEHSASLLVLGLEHVNCSMVLEQVLERNWLLQALDLGLGFGGAQEQVQEDFWWH